MHGVKRTPAERDEAARAAKLAERQRKMKAYAAVKGVLAEKQKKGEYDAQTLELTAKLLEKNPDIYTLWNWRRLALMAMQKAECPDLATFWQEELRLIECSLRENPKSYGAWHQRAWVIEKMPDKDYDKEIKLCNKALELDERNFHCWDYRRLVVRWAGKSDASELSFSDEKLAKNFSNYSAWHYRSGLLARLFPDDSPGACSKSVLQSERLASELELAKNAFFTDPEDQSAWLYSTWLMQRRSADADASAVRVVLATVHSAAGTLRRSGDCFHQGISEERPAASELGPMITLCFGRPVQLDELPPTVAVNGGDCAGVWSSPVEEATAAITCVFQMSVDSALTMTDQTELCISLSLTSSPSTPVTVTIPAGCDSYIDSHFLSEDFGFLTADASPASVAIVKDLLSTSQQLVELEPNVKWPALMAVTCERQLSGADSVQSVCDGLARLARLDPARAHYYAHAAANCRLGAALHRQHQQLAETSTLKLSSSQLVCLPRPQWLSSVTVLDLSNNALTSLQPLQHAVNLVELTANSNNLTSLAGLSRLRWLRFVSVASCCLTSADGILPHVAGCPSLRTLLFAENDVVGEQQQLERIIRGLPQVHCIPFWL